MPANAAESAFFSSISASMRTSAFSGASNFLAAMAQQIPPSITSTATLAASICHGGIWGNSRRAISEAQPRTSDATIKGALILSIHHPKLIRRDTRRAMRSQWDWWDSCSIIALNLDESLSVTERDTSFLFLGYTSGVAWRAQASLFENSEVRPQIHDREVVWQRTSLPAPMRWPAPGFLPTFPWKRWGFTPLRRIYVQNSLRSLGENCRMKQYLQSETSRLTDHLSSMNKSLILGIILTLTGVCLLVYQGFRFTTEERVVDIGPLKVNAERTREFPVPPIIGWFVTAAGVIVIVSGMRTRRN